MADIKAIQLMEGIYARVDQMVRDILDSWSFGDDAYAINIQFDGGGAALTAGAVGQVELPISGRIVGARMFVGVADTASSATVTAQIGPFEDYPTGLVLHGTGAIPTLTSDVKADLDVTDWVRTLYTRDILAYELTSFTGPAVHLTLSLLVHKLPEVIPTTTALARRRARSAARAARSLRNGSAA
jgi:hypothetical protein